MTIRSTHPFCYGLVHHLTWQIPNCEDKGTCTVTTALTKPSTVDVQDKWNDNGSLRAFHDKFVVNFTTKFVVKYILPVEREAAFESTTNQCSSHRTHGVR